MEPTQEPIPGENPAPEPPSKPLPETTAPETSDGFTESHVVRVLGCPRSVIREYRKNAPPDHWFQKGSEIMWTPHGMAALCASLTGGGTPEPSTEKKPAVEVLTVARTWLNTNRQYISCVSAGKSPDVSANWISVRVRYPHLFLPGMQLRAEEVPLAHHYRFLGPPDGLPGSAIRYPRRPGLW